MTSVHVFYCRRRTKNRGHRCMVVFGKTSGGFLFDVGFGRVDALLLSLSYFLFVCL